MMVRTGAMRATGATKMARTASAARATAAMFLGHGAVHDLVYEK
ncbi:hypothetical protein [Pandoraea oxalativorans]|nr:hypothetical protein [Pandoraea oxalativorans]